MTEYDLTWIPPDNQPHKTVRLRDITPDDFLNAASDAGLLCADFTDEFLYRTLYSLLYQLQRNGDAEVSLYKRGTLLAVPRAV